MHTGFVKSLDDQSLTYEKRQKIEQQIQQIKGELEATSVSYNKAVQATVQHLQIHFTEKVPEILSQLETIEEERIKSIKVSYSKYAAVAHAAIPTTREMCDQMMFYTDQLNPQQQLSQFVGSILYSLKEPLKPPQVPRFQAYGDAGPSTQEDEVISFHFHKFVNTIKSATGEAFDITKNTKHKNEPKPAPRPAQNDDDDDVMERATPHSSFDRLPSIENLPIEQLSFPSGDSPAPNTIPSDYSYPSTPTGDEPAYSFPLPPAEESAPGAFTSKFDNYPSSFDPTSISTPYPTPTPLSTPYPTPTPLSTPDPSFTGIESVPGEAGTLKLESSFPSYPETPTGDEPLFADQSSEFNFEKQEKSEEANEPPFPSPEPSQSPSTPDSAPYPSLDTKQEQVEAVPTPAPAPAPTPAPASAPVPVKESLPPQKIELSTDWINDTVTSKPQQTRKSTNTGWLDDIRKIQTLRPAASSSDQKPLAKPAISASSVPVAAPEVAPLLPSTSSTEKTQQAAPLSKSAINIQPPSSSQPSLLPASSPSSSLSKSSGSIPYPNSSPALQEPATGGAKPAGANTVEISPAVQHSLDQLKEIVKKNDYYSIVNSNPTDNTATIGSNAKELVVKYKAILLMDDKLTKQDATNKLVALNEVCSTVFRNEKTRSLYDKVCTYRREYNNLLKTPNDLLQRAVTNLNLLASTIKKANFPVSLQEELDGILEIIKKHRNISA